MTISDRNKAKMTLIAYHQPEIAGIPCIQRPDETIEIAGDSGFRLADSHAAFYVGNLFIAQRVLSALVCSPLTLLDQILFEFCEDVIESFWQ